tara:strand:+ start:18548 stop:18889 length:342 start_codon:yes stop_codon:yes gene_type:complete
MATNYDLNITKGSQFDIALRAKDSAGNGIDLTNYTTSGFVKYRYSDTDHILNLNPVARTGAAGVSGYLDIKLSGIHTTGVPVVQGVYDIEIYSGQYHEKLIYGYANILPEVTY